MKLVYSSIAALGLASAAQMKLQNMAAVSDNCEGCENAPESPYTCDSPPCDANVCGAMAVDAENSSANNKAVQCGLPHGYYADENDCTAYCFCSGETDSGTGHAVPSRWKKCPKGTAYDAGCGGNHKALASGLGYEGGCCSHAAKHPNCADMCQFLGPYHCKKADACGYDAKCGCCKPKKGGDDPAHADDNSEGRKACKGKIMDLTFVIDGSGSIGAKNFIASKQFLKFLVSYFDVSPSESHVAAVQYSTAPTTEFTYSDDYDKVMTQLNAIPYQSKSTKTGLALKYTEENIIPDRRDQVKNVVVVLTDGVSYDTAADDVSIRGPELKAVTDYVVVIGVAKADIAQLNHIASDPSAVFFNSDWEYLKTSYEEIAAKICRGTFGEDAAEDLTGILGGI